MDLVTGLSPNCYTRIFYFSELSWQTKDALVQCCWKKSGCIHSFRCQQCRQNMKCLVSSYRKESSLKLWKGECNSLVQFLKLLLLHLNNGKSQILEIFSCEGELNPNSLHFTDEETRHPEKLRFRKNNLTNKTCNTDARASKTAVKNIVWDQFLETIEQTRTVKKWRWERA